MTIDLTTPADVLKTWALPELKDAQKAFAKNPTSTNWNVCVRAMLVYQQLKSVCSLRHPDNGKLMFDLESNPIVYWDDVICRHTLGMTCADALYKHN